MRACLPILLCFTLIFLLLGIFLVYPELDLLVSGVFANGTQGFYLARSPLLLALNTTAYVGARVLGGVFLLGAVWAFFGKSPVFTLTAKGWAFLFVALVVGPGLVANVMFKDHWGRARPREIVAFGGKAAFSPPLIPTDQCVSNCSFVSGDGAFGFFLPTVAYVVSRKRRRLVFWGLVGVGSVFSGARILMGAHFLSDVLYAAFFMIAVSAALHAAFFGWASTKICWKDWLKGRNA